MPIPNRGEVWLVDLGMVAKVRPCVVLSVPVGPEDRVLAALVAHTTSTRGSQFEVVVQARFLQAGAFDAQSLVTVPQATLIRRLGTLLPESTRVGRGRRPPVAGALTAS